MSGFLAWAHQFTRRHVSTIAFIGGFVIDAFTFQRVDLVSTQTVFVAYLALAATGILLVQGVETKRWQTPLLVRAGPWLPILVQFPLGGMYSGFSIFYTKSASLATSWPFLAIMFSLLVGNELLRRRYERLVFQVSSFYIVLLSYLILVTPLILGTINVKTFLFAGVSSLFGIGILTRSIKWLFPDLYSRSAPPVWLSVFGILAGFNVLYFTNTIPPVPLALTKIGIYHSVVSADGAYAVRYEAPPRYMYWRTTSPVYHRNKDEAAYCFASVFAPTPIQTHIYHSWQHRSPSGAWERVSRVSYSIEGGRDRGYRGYSIKTNLSNGEWRCVVETENGQVIGETQFTVVDSGDSPPVIHEATL